MQQSRLLALAVLTVASASGLHFAARTEVFFLVFFLLGSVWTVAIALLFRGEYLRNGMLLCGSILLSLTVVEACMYFATKSQIIIAQTAPTVWRQKDGSIGNLPIPNTATEFKEFLDDRLIDDVTYRIDANGLREIPIAVQGGPHKAVFFGCSYMFGHGVANDQTLPYYFVQDTKGGFEGFNFAGEGWGPHQMLREVETGFVRRVAGTPDLAIYEAIPDHLRRVAGRAPWEDGPRYELCQEGVCYAEPFHSDFYEVCRRWLERSWTVKFFESHYARLSRPSDLPLFLAVLKKTRSLLEENGTRFVIVLWDQNDLARTMLKTLRANQFDVVALSSIFPGSELTEPPLIQLDRHPAPATNKAIAAYLWRQVGQPLAYAKHPQ
jgi:hypothetical protein